MEVVDEDELDTGPGYLRVGSVGTNPHLRSPASFLIVEIQ